MRYHEYKFWSPEWDGVFVRVSTIDDSKATPYNPQEYFMILPWEDGRNWREQRLKALEMMEHAIQSGEEPGEVFADEWDEGYVQ